MKKIMKSKTIKGLLLILIFTIIYIAAFHLDTTKFISVYAYYGIVSLCLFTILLGIVLLIISKTKKIFDKKDCIIILLLYFSINIFFFCMVPVTLERSISVFMLNYMSDGHEYTKEEIEDVFISKYVYEYEAFDKRFEEQIYTGTIEQKEQSYSISEKGNFIVECFNFFKRIYNVKSKILG